MLLIPNQLIPSTVYQQVTDCPWTPYHTNTTPVSILQKFGQGIPVQHLLTIILTQQWTLSVAISSFHRNHANHPKRHHVIWVRWQNQLNMLIGFVMETLSRPMLFIKNPSPGLPLKEAMKLSVSSTILFHVTKQCLLRSKIIFINLINIIIFCNKLNYNRFQFHS